MRSIKKGAEPRALIEWKRENRDTPHNLYYGKGSSFPSEAVRQALLKEQFHLCAYTLRRLPTAAQCRVKGQGTQFSCHIEHVLSQKHHKAQSVAYNNLVACYPSSQTKVACGYGAVEKVEGLSPEAAQTIEVLKLNHPTLVNDRAAVIKGRLKPRGTPVSAATARRMADEVDTPDAQHCLPEYCEALKQQAERHARQLEKRAARVRGQARP